MQQLLGKLQDKHHSGNFTMSILHLYALVNGLAGGEDTLLRSIVDLPFNKLNQFVPSRGVDQVPPYHLQLLQLLLRNLPQELRLQVQFWQLHKTLHLL
jgi:hypothetical protein